MAKQMRDAAEGEGGERTDLLSDQEEACNLFGIEVSQASINSLRIAQQRAAKLEQEVADALARNPPAESKAQLQAKQVYSPVAAASPEQVGFELTGGSTHASSSKLPRSCLKKKTGKANLPSEEPGRRAKWDTVHLCRFEGSGGQEEASAGSDETEASDNAALERSVPRLTPQQKHLLYSNRPDLHINPDWMHRYQSEMRANHSSNDTLWASVAVVLIILGMFVIVLLSLFFRTKHKQLR
jgi:hypothetical protein